MAADCPGFRARGLVCDLDGTLLDTEPLYYKAYAKVAAEFGHPYSFETHRMLLGRAEIEGAGALVRALNLPCTPHELLEKRDVHLSEEMVHVTPLPGAMDALRLARPHVRLALATSSHRCYLHLKQQNNKDLFSMFEVVVCGDDEAVHGKSKPDPAIFLAAAAALGVPPGECVALEDSIAGIRSARAAGMFVVAIPDPRLSREEVAAAEPHVTLPSLTAFDARLLGL